MNDFAAASQKGVDPAVVFKALFLAAIALFVAVPLLATALGGFKSLGELRVNAFGLPREWGWENYADILLSRRYWELLRNSLIISLLTTTLTLIVASMARSFTTTMTAPSSSGSGGGGFSGGFSGGSVGGGGGGGSSGSW